MGKTLISDVIVPEVFNGYVINRTAELSAIYQSGIVATNDELNRLATSGGRLINMPYWNDLVGDDEVLSDANSLGVEKITTGQDIAVLLMRGKAWSANDLAQALSGDDPMGAIGNLVSEYWARRWQATLLSILTGVFAAPSMADNVYTIAKKITASETVNALQKLGDAKSKLTAFCMHSAVEAELTKQDLISITQPSDGSPAISTYLGKPVIVDDGCPYDPDTKQFTTYIFGAGAIGLGEGSAPVPTETTRDSLAGDDILINRRHFILHPRGVKWTDATVAGSSPTNAELADPDNWQRVYDPKNIRMVKFVHKIV